MAIRISEEKILKEIIRLLERRGDIKSLTEYYYSTKDLYSLSYIFNELTGEDLRITM